jgi:hypothetical protein
MSVAGSRVSSAASGTPSMARKNQIPYGNAAQRPTRPNGRNELAPAAFVASMLNRFATSNCGIMPTTKTTSATTAMAVMANMTLSASPTP